MTFICSAFPYSNCHLNYLYYMNISLLKALDHGINSFILTLAGRAGIGIIPSAVGLATDDPLTPVVISWVTDEHHDGVILVLGSVDLPPSPMIHS